MRKYELIVILEPSVDPLDTKKIDGIIRKLLGTGAGYIKNLTVIGKKQLAYEIGGHNEGVYVEVILEAPKIDSREMSRQTKLMTEIIRYSLILV